MSTTTTAKAVESLTRDTLQAVPDITASTTIPSNGWLVLRSMSWVDIPCKPSTLA